MTLLPVRALECGSRRTTATSLRPHGVDQGYSRGVRSTRRQPCQARTASAGRTPPFHQGGTSRNEGMILQTIAPTPLRGVAMTAGSFRHYPLPFRPLSPRPRSGSQRGHQWRMLHTSMMSTCATCKIVARPLPDTSHMAVRDLSKGRLLNGAEIPFGRTRSTPECGELPGTTGK
jgi:hypothetical protein